MSLATVPPESGLHLYSPPHFFSLGWKLAGSQTAYQNVLCISFVMFFTFLHLIPVLPALSSSFLFLFKAVSILPIFFNPILSQSLICFLRPAELKKLHPQPCHFDDAHCHYHLLTTKHMLLRFVSLPYLMWNPISTMRPKRGRDNGLQFLALLQSLFQSFTHGRQTVNDDLLWQLLRVSGTC